MASVMPKGAQELLIALQTPSPKGYMGIPALVWGAPGEGKSSFIESLHREDFPVVTLIASIHDPTDFSGLPVHENGQVRFIPPEWASAFDEAGQGILFLDELTTSPPSVQAALLRIVLERKVGFRSLPKGVRVVAAANPADVAVVGWELSAPLSNRFVHIQWELPTKTYLKALEKGFESPSLPEIDPAMHSECQRFWRAMAAAFLRRSPNLLHTLPADGEKAFASPRTWDYAIALMTSCDLLGIAPRPGKSGKASEIFLNLVKGCVGEGVGISFAEFLKSLRIPDPEKVLAGKEKVSLRSLRDDEIYALFSSMAMVLAQKSKQPKFVEAMLIFLDLVEEVCKSGKVDVVFAPVEQVVKGMLLQQAIEAARKEGMLREMVRRIHAAFEETQLKDFVELLTKS